ncbi:unnamed protein product [Rhizophagus irregularis]|nr:unnamed protein product [Rhizophagus irregularis]
MNKKKKPSRKRRPRKVRRKGRPKKVRGKEKGKRRKREGEKGRKGEKEKGGKEREREREREKGRISNINEYTTSKLNEEGRLWQNLTLSELRIFIAMLIYMESLSTHIKDISQKHYIPSSNVSVDEMIVRFSDCSSHTFQIKNKPIPKGKVAC